jgi:putative transposase
MILKEGHAMTVLSSVPAGEEFDRQLAAAEPDVLRLMVKSFAEALMSAEADAQCGAEYGKSSPERTNSRKVRVLKPARWIEAQTQGE